MTLPEPPSYTRRPDLLAGLMRESLDLMEEVMRLAASRNRLACARREALSAAAVVRLSTRLARISGWLLCKSQGGPAGPAARAVLAGALRGGLDARRLDQQADALTRRVDRLAANAIRLDTALARKIAPAPDSFSRERT